MNNSDLTSKKVTKKLSVVIPVFNNSESLPELRERLIWLSSQLSTIEISMELIFVDDGSSDNSFAVLKNLDFGFAHLRLIKLVHNFGAVRASRTGVKFVTGDLFTILAADLQDPPELIFEMVQKWKLGEKFIICVRRSRKDPFISRIFSRLHYAILRKFLFKDYPRGGFDMALIDSDLLDIINVSVKTASVPLLVFSLGYRPSILMYDRQEREFGVSGWTFVKKFNFFLDLIFGYSNKPIRLISTLGVFVSLGSFGYGFLVVIYAILNQIAVPGFAALAALGSFLAGIQILMLGIIGEYLWRVYEQVNNRPLAVIETEIVK